MKVLSQEMKKVFRPGNCLIALAVLVALSVFVPGQQAKTVLRMHTNDYPEQFGIYDDYSVDVRFEDHLLEVYGGVITEADREDLKTRLETLEEQLIRAAKTDEILLRIGTFYEKGLGFVGARSYEDEIDEGDQIYEWGCINGQVKLEGMDHQIGFVDRYRQVLDVLTQDGIYHVLGVEPFAAIYHNLRILVTFVYAGMSLIIVYCNSEVRSRTERLAYTTKTGRSVYLKKVAASTFAGCLVTLLGTAVAILLFSQWEIQRYYNAVIDSGLSLVKTHITGNGSISREKLCYGITFFELYIMLIGMLWLGSLSIFPLVSVICLRARYAVSAIALVLPVFWLVEMFWLQYYTKGIGRSGAVLNNRYEPFVLLLGAFVVSIMITVLSYSFKREQDL